MTGVLTTQRGQPFTRADLDAMPDDGHRYELIDGVLVVTPAPSPRHQVAALKLVTLLQAAAPPEMQVMFAPLDVALADDTVMQPDVLVARWTDFTRRDLPTAPMLAVEILSPSTRRIDRTLKRSRLEAAGCPAFWIVDPDEPSLTAWDLQDGRYEQMAHVTGDEAFTATVPFEVTVIPNQLRRD